MGTVVDKYRWLVSAASVDMSVALGAVVEKAFRWRQEGAAVVDAAAGEKRVTGPVPSAFLVCLAAVREVVVIAFAAVSGAPGSGCI